MKDFYPIILIVITVVLLFSLIIKATDKICQKTYSKEFMQTSQYKDMQCPKNH